MFLLVPAHHPGSPGYNPESRKTVVRVRVLNAHLVSWLACRARHKSCIMYASSRHSTLGRRRLLLMRGRIHVATVTGYQGSLAGSSRSLSVIRSPQPPCD